DRCAPDAGAPMDQAGSFAAEGVQRHDAGLRGTAAGPAHPGGVDEARADVAGGELAQLEEDRAAAGGGGRMTAPRPVAEVGARPVHAALVGERAREDQDLLATGVLVLDAARSRGEAYEGGEAAVGAVGRIQDHPPDAGRRAARPWQGSRRR